MAQPRTVPGVQAQSIWRDRDFLLYSLGNGISYMGTWAQRIGIGWLS